MNIIAQITSKDKVILTGLGQRVEIDSSHSKYNDVLDAMRGSDQDQLSALFTEIVEEMKAPKVAFTMTKNSISLTVDDETTIIGRFDVRFSKIKEAIEAKRWTEVVEYMSPAKALEGSGFEMRDGKVFHDNEELAPVIAERLRQLIVRGMPFDPILNFWKKLKNNPSFNTRKQLFSFLEANNVPLREDGDFVAYKKVRADFKDIHSGTMDNSVGKVVTMSRTSVDDNPNNTCSSGLHVCSFDYLPHFGKDEGDKVVLCSVSPEHVVSVPVDYNNAKMRTCQYTVIEEMEYVKPLNKPVYESETTYDDENYYEDDDSFEDEHGYTEELKDQVLSAYNEHSHRYNGEGLIQRILEDVDDTDEETVEQILVDEGYSDF